MIDEKKCSIFSLGGFEGFKRPVRVYSTNIDRYSIEEDRWDLFFSDGPELSSFAACADDRSIYFGGGKNAHWFVLEQFVQEISFRSFVIVGRKPRIFIRFHWKNVKSNVEQRCSMLGRVMHFI